MSKFRLYIFLVICVSLSACIHNDIPYPRIQANILSISAVDQSRPAVIDSINRMVTISLPESANIYSVEIDQYSITDGARITEGSFSEPISLAAPYHIILSLYQDYEWTIVASQPFDRYFTVDGQVGQSIINADAHTVTAQVAKSVDLADVKVTSCKLGPSCAVSSPDIVGATVDFTNPVEITLDNFGHKESWTITVTTAITPVSTVSVDAWTCVAWVYAEGEDGQHNTVQYRIKGDTQWITVPDSWLFGTPASYYARLCSLQPLTTYEARAYTETGVGEALTFTTGASLQMPNSDFDNWWLDGKVWCPWAEGGSPYWDTGNRGAATLGQSNSVPTDDTVDGQGKAAMLQTKFIGIGILGKLGAGNIFVGSYVRTDGTNGILSLGREFTERPTALTGYLKYKSAPISSTTAGFEDLKGRPDTCTVWIALIDSDEPLEIRTNPANRQLFDPEASYVVAYGAFQSGDDIDAYMPFEIPLNYRSTSRVPKYILVTASASKYGDYFTGGNGSVLYVDDFSLKYDY